MRARERARAVVAKVLGRPLKPTEIVHHADENPYNNENRNLVLCQDKPYHNTLHKRLRAYQSCGDANAIHCCYCGEWDRVNVNNMYEKGYHLACYLKARRMRKNGGADPGKKGWRSKEKCVNIDCLELQLCLGVCRKHYQEQKRRERGIPPRGFRL